MSLTTRSRRSCSAAIRTPAYPSQTATNALPWNDLEQGDGGDVAVDTITAAPNSLRYISSTFFAGFEQLTFTPGNAQVGMPAVPALNFGGAGKPAPTVQFFTPVRVNKITPARLVFGFNNDVYESLNQGANIAAVDLSAGIPAPGVTVNDGFGHLALVYGGVTGGVMNADLIYAGSGPSVYRRTAAPGTALTADRRLTRCSEHQ